jgi:hypothetical protein
LQFCCKFSCCSIHEHNNFPFFVHGCFQPATQTFDYINQTYHFQTCSIRFFATFIIYFFLGPMSIFWSLLIFRHLLWRKKVRKWHIRLTTRALIILVTKEPYYHQSPNRSQKTWTSICMPSICRSLARPCRWIVRHNK